MGLVAAPAARLEVEDAAFLCLNQSWRRFFDVTLLLPLFTNIFLLSKLRRFRFRNGRLSPAWDPCSRPSVFGLTLIIKTWSGKVFVL